MGKSRSATCMIAYLVQKYHITPAEALSQLRQARPLCEPNEGFMHQLELYHRMRATPDIEASPIYQRWLYQRAVEESRACGQAPEAEKIRFEDEHVNAATAAPPGEKVSELRCRKCRRTLATSAFLSPHERPVRDETPKEPVAACAHHFVDPLSWMRPELEQGKLDGRLECPNDRCKAVVGKYAWQGMRCSCGAWVVPAISLVKSKVDEVNVRNGGDLSGHDAIRRGPGVGTAMTKAEGKGLL